MIHLRTLSVVILGFLVLGLLFTFGGASWAALRQQGADPGSSQATPSSSSSATLPGSSQGEAAPLEASVAPAATLPVTPGLWYKYYTGSDFISRSPTQCQPVYVIPGGICSSTATSCDFITRLDLPQGARITEIIFLFIDNSSSDMSYWLVRFDPLNDTFSDLISKATSGASSAVRTQTTTGSPITTIDNRYYTYQLQVRTSVAGTAQTIKGFRVGFQIPAVYLPLVMR